jgi:hypothetical protein
MNLPRDLLDHGASSIKDSVNNTRLIVTKEDEMVAAHAMSALMRFAGRKAPDSSDMKQ